MIVILNSPLFKESNPLYDEDSLPPLGLGYIATNLQENGIEVQLIDGVYQRISLSDLISTLNHLKPSYLASNIFTTNYEIVKELFESVSFKTHIIIGGLSTKELYKKIIDWETNNFIDIVIGDGEIITSDIVKGNLSEEPFFQNENRRVFKVTVGSKYLPNDISSIPLNRSFFLNEPIKHPFGFYEANIIASRGCIFNCTFCAAARSLNREFPVRERSVESIRKEILDVKSKYPKVSSIRVLDDLFLKNRKSLESAIQIFKDTSLKWRSMAHVLTFNKADQRLLDELKKCGCHELFIGIESGSPRILKSINKTPKIDRIINNLSLVMKAGISIKGYFIYGFPNETESDMDMTFDLASRLKSLSMKFGSEFRTSVFQYRPYHATQIYHDLKSAGISSEVTNVNPNKELSDLVGRLQFNFHSGNYSNVDKETVHDYIYRTTNLTDSELFSDIKSFTRS